jgi:hypothetical protein
VIWELEPFAKAVQGAAEGERAKMWCGYSLLGLGGFPQPQRLLIAAEQCSQIIDLSLQLISPIENFQRSSIRIVNLVQKQTRIAP